MENLAREALRRLVTEHGENWSDPLEDRYFEAPLVKFASADGPVFEEYKQIIGAWYAHPAGGLRGCLWSGKLARWHRD